MVSNAVERKPVALFGSPPSMSADTTHRDVTQSGDPASIVWRYMTHDKFVSLLDKKALYFAGLAELDDGHEGSIPQADWDLIQAHSPDPQQWTRTRQSALQLARVNCWTMQPYESDALWKICAKGNRSLAIRATYARLRDSIPTTPNSPVTIGTVQYKNFSSAVASGTLNVFAPLYWKRLPFRYECEVRLAGFFVSTQWFEAPPTTSPIDPFVQCDLECLVDAIVISPYAEFNYLTEVRAIVENSAPKLLERIERSHLDTAPLF